MVYPPCIAYSSHSLLVGKSPKVEAEAEETEAESSSEEQDKVMKFVDDADTARKRWITPSPYAGSLTPSQEEARQLRAQKRSERRKKAKEEAKALSAVVHIRTLFVHHVCAFAIQSCQGWQDQENQD